MAARRLILAMLLLLVLSSIIVALIPLERERGDDQPSTRPATTPVADEGKLLVRRVSADAQKPVTIRMGALDELRLTVTSPVPNAVEIEGFGGFEDVDPNFPAKFDLLPLEAGTFPVRLVDPAGLVATIEVAPATAPGSQ